MNTGAATRQTYGRWMSWDRWVPYVTATVGHFSADDDLTGARTASTFAIGGGTRIMTTDWVGVRIDLRDTFSMDGDGYFYFQGRNDDLIVSAGYNIGGLEIESTLLAHEAVAVCAVVGLPDEQRGQVVCAFVVLRPGHVAGEETAKALQEFVKARIAPYKYPRRVEFVATLPRSETGKLLRVKLREPHGPPRAAAPMEQKEEPHHAAGR